MTSDCVWTVYDEQTRGILGLGLFLAGAISLLLSGWMLAAFIKSTLTHERSHLTLLNLCVASLARTLLGGFLFSGTSGIAGRWLFGSMNFKLFGFLNQFTSVYQIEALTHVCIERYVLAKYIKNGWEMTASRYTLFTSLCWFFSTVYSVLPLLAIGDYSWDYSCTACTLNLVLPTEYWPRYIFISVLFFQSVKPAIVMISMLYWARCTENQCYNEKEHSFNLKLTQSTVKVTLVTVIAWLPMFIASSLVVTSQMFGSFTQPPLALAMLAAIASEFSSAAFVLTTYLTNDNVKTAMLAMFGETTHIKNS